MTRKELVEFLKNVPDEVEIRVGSFCDDIMYCERKTVRINFKEYDVIQISSDNEDY